MLQSANLAAASRNEHSSADIVKILIRLNLPLNDVERFPKAFVDNLVQRFPLNFPSGKPGFVLEQNRFPRKSRSESYIAFFHLQFLRAGGGYFQADGDIVRDVVSADG